MHRRIALSAVAAAAVAVLATAGPAAAHVTVNPNTAAQGGFAKLSFRVPTEREVATTKIEVAFPQEHPFAFVSVRPHPGWSYAVTKSKLATPITAFGETITEAVSRITWTAAGGSGIKAGEFDEFDVSVGPLPTDVTSVEFKALQTYADGEVVRWIETRTAGAAEPEHPAPTLTLTAAAPEPGASASASGSPGTGSSGSSGSTGSDEAADDDGEDSDDSDVLGWVGVGLGGLALLVALAALLRRRGAVADPRGSDPAA